MDIILKPDEPGTNYPFYRDPHCGYRDYRLDDPWAHHVPRKLLLTDHLRYFVASHLERGPLDCGLRAKAMQTLINSYLLTSATGFLEITWDEICDHLFDMEVYCEDRKYGMFRGWIVKASEAFRLPVCKCYTFGTEWCIEHIRKEYK